MNVRPVCDHPACTVDYTFNFDMRRFNILDHFILSGTLHEKCVGREYVLHDVDNYSDHDPIMLELVLDVQYVGFLKMCIRLVLHGRRLVNQTCLIIGHRWRVIYAV